ncbi:30S ribosomal protein S1 [Blochmannia endosymbiont of Camponotus sp.]|uniref:30S ribosomal protein S1 n=1 Tax=Blochmannia endosymbiont of Camponotus sp. TaxID=700220 RepID=UPI0020247BCF|nr:30S ribosomal protein S1 [Blochmannia endosymbiont of Camponotus sp.]URJ23711.1 30S ribosomal protein S1 [Blochmannia endosymbiont of Camponotus sp.]URJ25528.1 30S ribosomal protein S1 [Blochmannia endosymbiont of Camponotus sp.]
MTESFAQLFEESLKKIETCPGSIVRGVVVAIFKDIVLVDAGLKSESSIPIEQFYNAQGELEISIGDYVDVTLDAVEDGFGETVLSREKAKRYESWVSLEQAHQDMTTVTGIINGKVKGGFTVELNGVRAFLPGSLVDVKPIRDTSFLEGQTFEFKVIKLDHKRNNVVVSRRAVIESENSVERDQLLNQLHEGIEIKGVVKNLTDYGAFIDLGGVDGLLHITDMAWKRVKHPSDIVNVGDEIIVKVLRFDRERIRVSLGLKQLGEDPWAAIVQRHKEGSKLIGQVTNLTDYGCFIEIEDGIEGLVHVSEMDWTNKNIHPSKVVTVGESVEVMVLDIDEERRRISLGLKQCKINPWQKFSDMYNRGDRVMGKIKSITDFGIFIGLEGGIDGLVHLSDISWYLPNEESVNKYKKGDEIIAVVLQVDAERERISLGIKQLTEDPLNVYLSVHKKGSMVSGKILSIDEKGGAIVTLDDDMVIGYLSIPAVSNNKSTHKKSYMPPLHIGKDILATLDGVDRKNRIVNLSACNICDPIQKPEANIIDNHIKEKDKNFSSVMVEAFKAATKNE